MKRPFIKSCLLAGALALAGALSVATHADEVTDWNQNLLNALSVGNTSPLVATRVSAIVQSAVFDALNGIERRYTPVHVTNEAPQGASRRAAVVQAAYATLIRLFPAQADTFNAERLASLAAIAADSAAENSRSIASGLNWGQSVANQILAWRATDGFTPAPPPFTGGNNAGEWRPTPPANLPGAAPQFATMVPWAIESPDQFRPPGPPALDTAAYAADYNETKSLGDLNSITRTDDQTLLTEFWNASTVSYFWNSTATRLAAAQHFTLSDNARLLALLDVAMADAAIACWDAKYHYIKWRPITAIELGDTDGNDDTVADPSWQPLLTTPNHPEYPSGHSTTSGAACGVLSAIFGEETPLVIDSDVMTAVTRSFPSFAEAQEEIKTARIAGGIHFRTACHDGQILGNSVADYVLQNVAQRIHGEGQD